MITEKDVQKSLAIMERDSKVTSRCSHLSYFPLAIKEAHGSIITDEDGNEFIDFLSSASSLNTGSSNPIITEAIEKQLKKFTQYTHAYSYNEETTAYAERLTSVFPGGAPAKICFGNCGSDGNDAAVKFARAYTGRQKILVFQNGYHGSTYGSATMTTCSPAMHNKMGPFLPEVYVFPFYGIDRDDADVEENSTKLIEEAFNSYMPPEEVAAAVIEPVQGDGGILPAHPVFLHRLYDLCKAHGILFISEEVQQGFYRTGKFFAIENYDIVPDALIMGKSIGGSLTLGAFMGRPEILDCLPAPAHLFTLGGNSIACAAGIAQFDYMQTPEFQELLASNIKLLGELAEDLKQKHPETVEFYRSLGMSMAIGVKHREEDTDNNDTFKILFRCYQYGLIIISIAGNKLRVQPPLNTPPEQLRKGFEIIDKAMNDFEEGKIGDEVLKYKAGW